jgi:hypothetical protein
MSVVMRIVQRFDACDEAEFMALEKRFAALETKRRDLPQGRRLQPLAASEPCNTLIWEGEFPTLAAAHAALNSFSGDAAHEKLARKQRPLFRRVRVEFYNVLDF